MALSDQFLFFKRFMQHPLQVAALVPSSRGLARLMVEGLTFEPGEGVVELGPGTGVFTERLVPLLPDPSCYIGIDRDPVFVPLLRKRYPQLNFVQGMAEEVDRHVREAGIRRIKAVVSGLPWASMPEQMQRDIVGSLNRLMQPGSEFRTFQYLHIYKYRTSTRFRAMMSEWFGPYRVSRAIWFNVLPAVVVSWRRAEETSAVTAAPTTDDSSPPASATEAQPQCE
ncbi:MAG: hypothetical protein JJU36_10895 [Phycisphaeraceae bacterium]|nr:hypothetical protein [Phycisphaeraceae bacterium]